MHFASGIAEDKNPQAAIQSALEQVIPQLSGLQAHLAALFVSSLYQADWQPMVSQIRQRLGGPLLIGCTGGGVLGGDQELEFTPAVSLAAAHLPGVKLHPFTVIKEDLEEERGPGFWIEKLGVSPSDEPVGFLLPEPFSCDCMGLVASVSAAYPRMPLIGGLASGADHAGGNALFMNDNLLREGAVGVILTGNVTLQTIVSQGCRPIGRPYIVTKAKENVILELAGMPATEALRRLILSLSDQDKELARRNIFLGVVMNEQKEKFERGDFLVRNLIGMDADAGALAVGDRMTVGQTVQFQLRDAETSKEDLNALLTEKKEQLTRSACAGGFLFNCLGRGKDLYGKPHVDIRTIRASLGNLPIAGFFCNGEIGPIGDRNFIHGFTSSLGLFRPRLP